MSSIVTTVKTIDPMIDNAIEKLDIDDVINEFVEDYGIEGASYFTNPDYVEAIIGTTTDGRIVYSYEKMVEYLMLHDDMSEDEAAEFVDYNTVRTLPYMEQCPVIVYEII